MEILELQQTQTIAMVIGLVVLYVLESVHPFFSFYRERNRSKHALRNLVLGGFNAGIVGLVFVGLWFAAASWAEQEHFGLMNWLEDAVNIPGWLRFIGAVLLLDLWTYLWHRINHVVPFF